MGLLAQGKYLRSHTLLHIILSVQFEELQFTRQSVGTTVLLEGSEVGILPVAHPCDGQHPLSGVGEGNGGIVVLAIVEPLGILSIGAHEVLAVEVTHEVLCGTTSEETSGIDIHNHHPLHILGVAIDRQLEEVGALILTGLLTHSLAKGAHVIPLFEILGLVEACLLVGRDYHVPALALGIPEHLGVAEVAQSIEGCEHRVSLILGEGTAVVIAVGHALYLSVLVAGRCIESHDGILAIPGSVACIHHAATREDVSQGIARDGWVELFPVYQVAAYGMSPVHVSPHASIGVVLEVEMIFAVLVYHSVRIVHPSINGCEMIRGAVVIGLGSIKRIAELHQVEGQRLLGQTQNLHLGTLPLSQGKGYEIVGSVLGETYVHPGIGIVTGIQQHSALILVLLYGEEEITGGTVHSDYCGISTPLNIHCLSLYALGHCHGCHHQTSSHHCFVRFHFSVIVLIYNI